MDPTFRVFIFVNRPRHEVFEAVADPKELSAYFTTGGASARLEEGQTVTWDFADRAGDMDHHLEFEVHRLGSSLDVAADML